MPTDNSNAFSPQDLTRTEDQSRAFPNARGQVVPAIESAPEEPQDWQTPMAEPEGGWQQEGTPLTIQARPKEVNKILNSKHVLSDVDTSDPSNARVFVANFLNSKYDEDKRGIYKDYEGKTKAYGLSGDPVADAKSIRDGDTKTHESSQTRIAKDRKVIAEGLDKLGYEERQSFGANAKNTFDRGFLDLGVGTAAQGALKGIESMGDEMERIERGLFEDLGITYYDEELGGPVTSEDVQKWREDVRERNTVDPEFLNSYTGGVIQGYGQAAAIVPAFLLNPAVGTGMSVAQAYQYGEDGYRDFVKSEGITYEESEARKAGLWNMPSAAVDVIANRFAIGKILKPLKGAKITKGGALEFLKDTAESAAMGSGTEGVQTVWENLNAKYLSGYDRDKVLTDGVVDAMVIGAFVDSTITAGGQGVTKGVNKLLGKTMDPVEGMTAVDWALALNVVPEAEFAEHVEREYGDEVTEDGVPLAELAWAARGGDRKAAQTLVDTLTLEVSVGAKEAGLTPAEAEARGKEAAEVADPVEPLVETPIDKEISTKKEELAALEEAEDSTPEDMKSYEKLDKEIQALETKRVEEIVKGKIMTPFTRGMEAEQERVEQARLDKEDKDLEEQDQVIDLINILSPLSVNTTVENMPELAAGGAAIIKGWKDAGFSKKEIAAKSKELMTAQGMPNTRLEDVVQKGSQKSTKTDGSPIQSLIKLFKGANPFTVVEEFAHAEYDREIAEGTVTVEQVREWRKVIEELTDTPDLRGETDEDIKEWVAEQVKARIYGQRNNLSLPESFLKFLDDIISGFKQILGRAKELQDLEASGQLPTDFLEMLDRQGLVGKPVGTPSTQANAGISEQENIDRVETFSLEHTDPALGYTYSYDKDSDKFKQLVKDGYITTNKTLEDFDGEIIFLHQPDGAFSGQLKHGDEVLVEGQGGVFYPIKFHEGGYFWASTDNAAKKMAADLNKVYKQNNGKIYMALTSAPVEKLLSSTTMANAVMDFFSVKASDPKVKLPEKEVQGAIIEAANASKVQDVYNPDTGETKSVRVSLGLDLDPNDSYAENVEKIKAMLAPDKSSFDARKLFSVNIANSMAQQIEASPDAKEMLGSFFSTGLNNKYSKIKRGKDGDLSKMSGAGMVQALSDMLSEPLTKPFQQRANQGGYVYAVLEINSKVKPVEAVGMHTSYPMAIQSVDDSKATVHILQQAPHWSTVFEDPKTGKIVKKNRLKSVYPSSGASTTGVKANTSENPRYTISPVSAEADVKYVKWLELSSMEGTDEEIIAAGEAAVKAGGTTKTFQKWVSKGEVKKIQATAMSLAKSKMKNTAKSMGYTLNKEENVFEGYGKTKSADITYNADGTPITLSDRFDDTNVDESYSLEPLSEQDADAEATVAAEERQSRTPERQAFIDYQRELRRTQLDNTEEEKEKLQKLLQLATDADEIEALKQAGDEKIIRVVEQKVKQIRKQAAEREDVTESVKSLERLINSPEVPMEVRARMRGFGRLAERKTPQGKARWVEQMANKLEAEIDRHYRTRNVRTLRSLLRPFATEYAPNRRKLRERVGEEARADLNFAQRLLNNSEATPPEGMTDERRDELIDIFGDVGNRQSNPTRVKAALEIAGSIAKGGRTSRDDFKEDRRQRNEQVGDLVREEVLNGEQAMGKSQIAAREKQRNIFKKGYDYMRSRLIRGMEGFQQQLNKMDSVKGGILEDLFLPAVYQADQNEKALNREHVERVNEDFKTVLGTDNRQAASWYENSHELHDTDIEWIEDRAIGMEKRTISKQQGVALFMQWLDPSLRSTFSNMGINEATIEQVKEFIGEIGVSESYYFRERYAEMGIRLNAKHIEVEGIPMDMIDGYGGRAYRINSVGSSQEDMQMFSTNSSGRPTVKSGSMKERTNSTDYLIFKDAAMDFSAHAKEVNHYISHAELAKNLSAAFLNNARARNAIKQKHGADFYDSLKEQVEAIIEGDPKITNKTDRDWNRIRSNVTKAQLMAKPAILIKQLTSAPAFVEEIGPVAYAKAAASLTRNARKFMPMIWGSEYVKNRMSNSQFADIQQQLDQRDNTLKGLRWDDYAMMNVKWGDIGAVIAGGAPVYVHAYNEAKAAGMTNDQAQTKAEEVFGLASERAQQSSATHAKGAFLRGKGAARTWFMYLTSPLQYQRNVNTGIANLVANVFEKKAGRKSEVKKAANQALRAIVIYHVLLPQIFQAVASGLVGFTDDEDYIKEQFWAKQRRALYAGNLNAIPLAGQLITVLANLAAGTGESWDSSGSPIIDLVGEVKQDFEKAVKNGDDLSKWLELSSSAGLAAGIPVKTINNYYDAITDISEGNTEHPFLRAGGWSKWSIFED